MLEIKIDSTATLFKMSITDLLQKKSREEEPAAVPSPRPISPAGLTD